MVRQIDHAAEYKQLNPSEFYLNVARRFEVSKSTLNDRVKGIPDPHGMSAHRLLSLQQERVLINRTNVYATKGTVLNASQVREFAQAICGERVGIKWVGRFVERLKEVIHSTFFAYQTA
ncbi:MAG: hypothetical protein TREMPRED_005030, partial [Tremellales sp. Tagirdzhanova-0007]